MVASCLNVYTKFEQLYFSDKTNTHNTTEIKSQTCENVNNYAAVSVTNLI